MKANKNIFTTTPPLVALLLLIVFQSCGTYHTSTSDIESNLFSGDFNQAVASIDQNKFLLKDRNRLLYLMEKGKIEHLRGNYEVSNTLLEEAYIMIDDRIKTNAGQAIAAKFTNPMAEPYKGEDFEKVTIHYYKALNFFLLGKPNEALVEAKRINIKLYELNENYKENKNKYSEDAFSQILQGIIYESTGDINNAFIAYRNAYEIYEKNNNQFFGVPLPEQLKKDLLRTTKRLGFREEHEYYRSKFGLAEPAQTNASPKDKAKKTNSAIANEPEATGEAIVFWENGLGPAKDQIIITASGGSGVFYASYMDGDVLEEILIPVPPGAGIGSINAIAIPKYRKRESYYTKATVIVDNKEEPLEIAQDFYPIAKQCLKDRMLRETIDLIARFATKKAASAGLKEGLGALLGDTAGDIAGLAGDAAGAITEKADTRNWQTLPATIGYIRLPLKENAENRFVIKKYGSLGIDTDTLTIPYKKGLQIVNYFDLGRTQILPAPSGSTPAMEGKNKMNTSLVSPLKKEPVKLENNVEASNGLDNTIAMKYNQWTEATNGISYNVTYKIEEWEDGKYFGKSIAFKSANNEKVKIKYTITESPFDNTFTEVSYLKYYEAVKKGEADKLYYTQKVKLKPGEETSGSGVLQKNPDVYVTILSVEQ